MMKHSIREIFWSIDPGHFRKRTGFMTFLKGIQITQPSFRLGTCVFSLEETLKSVIVRSVWQQYRKLKFWELSTACCSFYIPSGNINGTSVQHHEISLCSMANCYIQQISKKKKIFSYFIESLSNFFSKILEMTEKLLE